MNITSDDARAWARSLSYFLEQVEALEKGEEYAFHVDRLGKLHTALLKLVTEPVKPTIYEPTAGIEFYKEDDPASYGGLIQQVADIAERKGVEECFVCDAKTGHIRVGNGLRCSRCGMIRAMDAGMMEKWRLKSE